MHKLSAFTNGEWTEHSFAPVFTCVEREDGSKYIEAGVPKGDAEVFLRLVTRLEAPYYLLYILHTPRSEAGAGRYQSPALSHEQLQAFIATFKDFLAADSRFDLWAHSPAERATVVWDRHNLLYAYGPVQQFSEELHGLGFQDGKASVSTPHQHHYRAEMDDQAAKLLGYFDWSHSPLRAEDEQ